MPEVQAGDVVRDVTVLIADDDRFEAAYVADVMAARGICVVGPSADPSQTFDAIGAGSVQAAIVGRQDGRAGGDDLIAQLEGNNIPYLTLRRVAPRCPVSEKPVLTPPFAGYQVADWVLETIVPKRS